MLGRIRCACVDMGAELGLAEVQGPREEDLLPRWLAGQFDLEPDAGGPEARPSAHGGGRHQQTLHNCLVVAGTRHILHNLTAGVASTLIWISKWMAGVRPLAHLLRHRHLRERFQA